MENPYLHAVCAGILTQKNQTAEVDRLHDCRDLLRSRTGFFPTSGDRPGGNDHPPCPWSRIPRRNWTRGAPLRCLEGPLPPLPVPPLAALLLADQVEERQYGAFAARTRAIYNGMKEAHCFLTGVEDSVFAALLALSPPARWRNSLPRRRPATIGSSTAPLARGSSPKPSATCWPWGRERPGEVRPDPGPLRCPEGPRPEVQHRPRAGHPGPADPGPRRGGGPGGRGGGS